MVYMAFTATEKQCRYREKLKSSSRDPVSYAETKRMNVVRYHTKKKLIKNMITVESRNPSGRWQPVKSVENNKTH